MENIKENINCGNGDGNGCSDGNGYGYGYGYSDGNGNGDGYGDGYGCGYGNGDGDGYGYRYGYSDGGMKMYNGKKILHIDNIRTIVIKKHGNISKGFIIQADMSLKPCYVAKNENYYAHGGTAREACAELQKKIAANRNTTERIDIFIQHFNDLNKKYSGREFFEWHNILTGSCEMGRKAFAKSHDIDIDKFSCTVKEFIDLTKNDFGGEIIKELERRIKNE